MISFSHPSRVTFVVVSFLWLVAGCGIAILAELWWRTVPHIIEVHDVQVSDIVSGGHQLTVMASGPPARDCLRFTQHALYRDGPVVDLTGGGNPWPGRVYAPLAAAVNGKGFGSVDYFTVTLFVPPSVPPGDWNYVVRSVYWCTVFPGFTKFTESVNPPVHIHLD